MGGKARGWSGGPPPLHKLAGPIDGVNEHAQLLEGRPAQLVGNIPKGNQVRLQGPGQLVHWGTGSAGQGGAVVLVGGVGGKST